VCDDDDDDDDDDICWVVLAGDRQLLACVSAAYWQVGRTPNSKASKRRLGTEFVATAADPDAALPRRPFGVVGARSRRLSETEVVVRTHIHRPSTLSRQPVSEQTQGWI